MSNEEKIIQEDHFKRIQRGFFKITFMQGVTIISLAAAAFAWYVSRDEKQIIDGTVLLQKVDKLAQDFKSSRAKDSIINRQQRFLDSVHLANQFADLKNKITADIERQLSSSEKRLDRLERKVQTGFVREIKKSGPAGPVTLQNTNNRENEK